MRGGWGCARGGSYIYVSGVFGGAWTAIGTPWVPSVRLWVRFDLTYYYVWSAPAPLGFVQGALALLTGERNRVGVRHSRFMCPAGVLYRGLCGW